MKKINVKITEGEFIINILIFFLGFISCYILLSAMHNNPASKNEDKPPCLEFSITNKKEKSPIKGPSL